MTEDGKILPPQQNGFETSQQAQARAKAQEQVWNLVWARRAVYFATVAATLYLLLYPAHSRPSGILRVFHVAAAGIRPHSDDRHSCRTSLRLGQRLCAEPRQIPDLRRGRGRPDLAGARLFSPARSPTRCGPSGDRTWHQPNSVAHRPDFRLRTSRPYRWLLSTLKWTIAPAFFAVLFLYLGLAFASHLISLLRTRPGLHAPVDAKQARSLGPAKQVHGLRSPPRTFAKGRV